MLPTSVLLDLSVQRDSESLAGPMGWVVQSVFLRPHSVPIEDLWPLLNTCSPRLSEQRSHCVFPVGRGTQPLSRCATVTDVPPTAIPLRCSNGTTVGSDAVGPDVTPQRRIWHVLDGMAPRVPNVLHHLMRRDGTVVSCWLC